MRFPTVQVSQVFMETAGFLLVIATGIGVILISLALDFLWARVIAVGFFITFSGHLA